MTNPNPMDLKYKVQIRRFQVLAGSIMSSPGIGIREPV